MEVKTLVKFEGTVVLLPVFFEEIEKPFFRNPLGTIFIIVVVYVRISLRGAVILGTDSAFLLGGGIGVGSVVLLRGGKDIGGGISVIRRRILDKCHVCDFR